MLTEGSEDGGASFRFVSAMMVKFRNPPINELVVGVYFEHDIAALRSEFVGVFWSRIRGDFPTIRQNPPVTLPGAPVVAGVTEMIGGDGEMFPLPRFWMESRSGDYLMQIQRNAFLFNWRRRDGAYPHYAAVKAAFDKYFAIYTEFLAEELRVDAPLIHVADLTYINLIQECEYWRGPRDTHNVLPRFQLPVEDRGADSPTDFNVVVVQRFASDLSLWTSVRNGRSTEPPNNAALIVELRAIGSPQSGTKSSVDAWFDRAHDAIGDCFLANTNPDIQNRYWERM